MAGAIGRLSLGVFGSADPAAAAPLADALGVALQLTNILRDIREDLGNGRVYLPAEDLEQFGCTLDPAQPPWWGIQPPGRPAPRARRPLRHGSGSSGYEADRARSWYATGLRLMPLLDWRSAACAGAMAGIYLRLLGHLAATPGVVLERRSRCPARRRSWSRSRRRCAAAARPRPPLAGPAAPPVDPARRSGPAAEPRRSASCTPPDSDA